MPANFLGVHFYAHHIKSAATPDLKGKVSVSQPLNVEHHLLLKLQLINLVIKIPKDIGTKLLGPVQVLSLKPRGRPITRTCGMSKRDQKK